jgi:hypothetical protein
MELSPREVAHERLTRTSGRVEIDGSKCDQQSPVRDSHRNRLSGRGRNPAGSQWSRDRPYYCCDHLALRGPRGRLRLGLLVRPRNRSRSNRTRAGLRWSDRVPCRTFVQTKTISRPTPVCRRSMRHFPPCSEVTNACK